MTGGTWQAWVTVVADDVMGGAANQGPREPLLGGRSGTHHSSGWRVVKRLSCRARFFIYKGKFRRLHFRDVD